MTKTATRLLTAALTLAALLGGAAPALAQSQIFTDGFESGDLSAATGSFYLDDFSSFRTLAP